MRAALVLVYTQSGQAAHLVAKYRPPVPIVALVIPRLSSDGMSWKLEGRGVARQALIVRGLLPVLAAPAPSSESLLEESVVMASSYGLVKPGDHVVVVQMVRDAFAVKIVTVADDGSSIAKIRPKSLMDLMKAAAGVTDGADMAVTGDGLLRTGSALRDDAARHPHLAFGSVPVARGALTSSPTMLVGDAARGMKPL